MFSKELEDLINYAISDGEIDKKEKQVIYKKAIEDGVDLDELEIYLKSKMYGQTSKDLEPKQKKNVAQNVKNKNHSKQKKNNSLNILPAIISVFLSLIVFFYFDNLIVSIFLSFLTFIFSFSIVKFIFDGTKSLISYIKYVLRFEWLGDLLNGLGNLFSAAFESVFSILSLILAIGILVAALWFFW